MKSISELYRLLTDLATPFAQEADSVTDIPTDGDGSATSFETGFPEKYAKKGAGGSDILRADMNALGKMATASLFFRRRGGVFSFVPSVSDAVGGYPERCLLTRDDGISVFSVESQEKSNTLDFVSEPSVIDSLANLDEDPPGTESRVLWKTVTPVYGAADGRLSFGVDFSRQTFVAPGDILEEDSLVIVGIGQYTYSSDTQGTSSGGSPSTIQVKWSVEDAEEAGSSGSGGSVVLDLANKGLFGLYNGYNLVVTSALPVYAPYPKELCGAANYGVSLFLKKGSSVTCTAFTTTGGTTTQTIIDNGVLAFPLVKKVGGVA